PLDAGPVREQLRHRRGALGGERCVANDRVDRHAAQEILRLRVGRGSGRDQPCGRTGDHDSLTCVHGICSWSAAGRTNRTARANPSSPTSTSASTVSADARSKGSGGVSPNETSAARGTASLTTCTFVEGTLL